MEVMPLMSLVNPCLKTSLIETNQGLILTLAEIERQPFNYLNKWMALNYIINVMPYNKKDGGNQRHPNLAFLT
jgi:hypothetical protein